MGLFSCFGPPREAQLAHDVRGSGSQKAKPVEPTSSEAGLGRDAALDPPLKPKVLPQQPAAAPTKATATHIASARSPSGSGSTLSGALSNLPDTPASRGLPHPTGEMGPPKPPCEDERFKTMQALGLINAPPDPEIANVLKLLMSIFDAPNALIGLFEDTKIYIKDTEGAFTQGDFPWRRSFCAWTMASPSDQVMIIEDATQDARFSDNPFVQSEPGVKFYAGTPLIASNGHRLGTLCFADFKPRQFAAPQYAILSNLAEVVVRRLEKDVKLQLMEHENKALAKQYQHLERALDCVDACVGLVDTLAPGFSVLFMTETWTKLTGLPRDEATGRPVTELFVGPHGEAFPTPEHVAAAREGRSFEIRAATLRSGAPTHDSARSGSGRVFVVRFKPATQEQLDAQSVPVGVPAYIPRDRAPTITTRPTASLYFMAVEPFVGSRAVSESTSTLIAKREAHDAIEGLTLGQLLGKGAFGSVYAGKYHGASVAVKLIEQQLPIGPAGMDARDPATLNLEAALSIKLRHPHVTSVLAVHSFLVAQQPDSLMSTSTSSLQVDVHITPRSGTSSNGRIAKSTPLPSVPESPGPGAAAPAGNSVPRTWAVINYSPEPLPEEECVDSSQIAPQVLSQEVYTGSGLVPDSGENMLLPRQLQPGDFDPCGSAASYAAAAGGGSAKLSAGEHTSTARTCIVMEYCDRGCLQDAIDRGWLFDVRSCVNGKPRMDVVLARASEIANALSYVHARGIIHGDLSSYNILLTSTGATEGAPGACGFVAKVADFGLARVLGGVRTKIQTRTYGTLTHQPPETLCSGTVSKAVDIYSFGVLLWQMYTGSRPWAGLSHAQIIMAVVTGGCRLQFPEGAHREYAKLALRCMAFEAEQRPTADEICARLQELRDAEGSSGSD